MATSTGKVYLTNLAKLKLANSFNPEDESIRPVTYKLSNADPNQIDSDPHTWTDLPDTIFYDSGVIDSDDLYFDKTTNEYRYLVNFQIPASINTNSDNQIGYIGLYNSNDELLFVIEHNPRLPLNVGFDYRISHRIGAFDNQTSITIAIKDILWDVWLIQQTKVLEKYEILLNDLKNKLANLKSELLSYLTIASSVWNALNDLLNFYTWLQEVQSNLGAFLDTSQISGLNEIENQISQAESQYQDLIQQYQSLLSQIQTDLATYQADIAKYQANLNEIKDYLFNNPDQLTSEQISNLLTTFLYVNS